MEDLVSNRKAHHNYEILETLESGIVLLGTEIKSLRNHGGNLQESYVVFHRGEAYLKNSSIAPYKFGNIYNHEERRERKLLLHKREIKKLYGKSREKGLALVPLKLYFKDGRVKVEIGIGKGKKLYDRREDIKDREERRTLARDFKTKQIKV